MPLLATDDEKVVEKKAQPVVELLCVTPCRFVSRRTHTCSVALHRQYLATTVSPAGTMGATYP